MKRYPNPRWMDLSFYSYRNLWILHIERDIFFNDFFLSSFRYRSKKPKILDWPGNTAQLGAQEAKGMSSVLLHTFFSLRPFRMRFARHWRFALLLFFIGRFGWTSPFFPNSNRKGCITSRCRFVFRPQWDGEFVTSVPSSF